MNTTLPKSVRLIAILNVIAWGGFWAFGFLALTSGSEGGSSQVVWATILAAVGAGLGIWAYMILMRASQMTGYEKKYERAQVTGSGSVNGEQAQ